MEEYIVQLMKDMKERNVKQKGSFKTDEGEVEYYIVESDEVTLRFWNSSNLSGVNDYKAVLEEIRDELLDGEESGELSDGWNSVMWELI